MSEYSLILFEGINRWHPDIRKKILEAAAAEFAEYGYEKANVNRIAEAAGYAIGTVYNYFATKKELMSDFIDETAKMHVDTMLEQVKSEADPRKRIEVFFKAGFAFVETHLTNTLNGPDQEFKQRLFQAYQALFQLLRVDILEPGIQLGIFRQVEPQMTSNLLMFIYLGIGSQLSPEGKLWLGHAQVADFVLHSLVAGKEK